MRIGLWAKANIHIVHKHAIVITIYIEQQLFTSVIKWVMFMVIGFGYMSSIQSFFHGSLPWLRLSVCLSESRFNKKNQKSERRLFEGTHSSNACLWFKFGQFTKDIDIEKVCHISTKQQKVTHDHKHDKKIIKHKG